MSTDNSNATGKRNKIQKMKEEAKESGGTTSKFAAGISGRRKTSGPKMVGVDVNIQRLKAGTEKMLVLPSGAQVTMVLHELDPDACVQYGGNGRLEKLMRPEAPKLASIISEMAGDIGQREPVYARWNENLKKVEVVDGATRKFCVQEACKLKPGLKLLAWVGPISDADADEITCRYNKDRSELSPYEEACQIEDRERRIPKPKSEDLMKTLGLKHTVFFKRKKLLDIPFPVVAKLLDPALITQGHGETIAAMTGSLSGPEVRQLVMLMPQGLYKDIEEYIAALELALKKLRNELPVEGDGLNTDNGNKPAANQGFKPFQQKYDFGSTKAQLKQDKRKEDIFTIKVEGLKLDRIQKIMEMIEGELI